MRKKKIGGKAYRFWRSKEDYEGIVWEVDDQSNQLVVKWVAAGHGELRQPVGTVHGDRLVITWTDDTHRFWVSEVCVPNTGLKVVLAKG